MTPEAIVHYLKQHPEFFEEQSEFLATVALAHPHGGRTVSISERQILTLREKGKKLEDKLRELIEFGEQNDVIGEKLHRLTLAMIAARDAESAIQAMYFHLREDFAVPHAVVRIWRADAAAATGPEFAPVSEEVRQYAAAMQHPFCGPSGHIEIASWFGEAASQVRSVACMPLRDGGKSCFGILALASEDVLRFYPEMGTLYLERLGELTSAALLRYL